MKTIRLLSLGLILTITSCGFHLRGTTGFQFSSIMIQSERADSVSAEVKRILEEQNVKIVSIPQEAQAIVQLSDEKFDRRALSVSALSGKLEEIELNFRVFIEIRRPNEEILQKIQAISLSRDYSFDETSVLAMGTEEDTLKHEIFQDVVAQIIRRLESIESTSNQLNSK